MSKVLLASCDSQGVVKVDGITVPEAVVLSEGKQASNGLLIIEGETVRYIALSAADLKTTLQKTSDALEKTAEALTQIATTLTSIGAGMLGPATAPPPTLASDVSTITSKVSLINSLKTELNSLSEALR